MGASSVVFLFALAVPALPVGAKNDPDCTGDDQHHDCGRHNMMLVGTEAVYLSHLPMFDNEHRFQVILEAQFEEDGKHVDGLYFDDRGANPEIGMYTVKPLDIFVLSRLFTPEAPERMSFPGDVFRGHLERGGKRINGLTGIDVTVTRVVYARELGTEDEPADQLRYILFGNNDELFLAHQITHAPDFDQIIAVDVDGHDFKEDELAKGVIITVPDRDNTGEARLRTEESVAATAAIGDSEPIDIRVDVVAEPYFEDGELQSPADFGTTPLEMESGF
jgi:hypothetical protein